MANGTNSPTNWASGTGTGWSGGGSSVGQGDILTVLKILNQNMSQLIQTIQGVFPRATGTLTMAAATTTTVQDASVAASAIIVLSPANQAAATLQGSAASPWVSAVNAGVGFTVTTASAAHGTEMFNYFIVNPS